jgi:hypothetical protein
MRSKYEAAHARIVARARAAGLPHDAVDAGYRSVIEYLGSPDLQHLTPKLLERLRIIDGVRGEDFRAVFPELSGLHE